jgi:hypothetical protein
MAGAEHCRLADLSGDQGAALTRRMLDRISRKQDGTVASANTANRKRMVLGNAMEYACKIGGLPSNPLKRVKWTKPRLLRTRENLDAYLPQPSAHGRHEPGCNRIRLDRNSAVPGLHARRSQAIFAALSGGCGIRTHEDASTP